MSREYFNRYQYFINSQSEIDIVPGVEIPIKSTDKYVTYKRGKDRLDRISDEEYNSPVYGWLIMLANPSAGLNEHEIPDNFILRIPLPLKSTLQDYKKAVEQYKLYYGE